MEEYRLPQPLAQLPVDLTEISELRIYKLFGKLNPSKARGPDEIPNWMLKGYAETLAFPISRIISTSAFNSAFRQTEAGRCITTAEEATGEGP